MSRRILVVDDEPLWRRVLDRRLRTAGYEVECVANGALALRRLSGVDPLPDLILTDLFMPEAGGYEVCAGVRGNPRLATIPIIMMSSMDSAAYRDPARAFGIADYLVKPLGGAAILAAVHAVLGPADR